MKNERKRHLSRAGEYGVSAVLLAVYALAIFLSPDPEWIVWAGQMTVGVIDPAALPPPRPADAIDALRTASALSVLGLLAVGVPGAAAAGMRSARVPRPTEDAAAETGPRRREAERRA